MGAISIGIENVRGKIERVIAIDETGKTIVRWGLIVVLAWIGGMKFTAYEAIGIQPLVAHSHSACRGVPRVTRSARDVRPVARPYQWRVERICRPGDRRLERRRAGGALDGLAHPVSELGLIAGESLLWIRP